jgi:coenzyme F420 hydrogenase subunit beta
LFGEKEFDVQGSNTLPTFLFRKGDGLTEELKWFLKDAVVDKGLCTYCGACASVCPYGIIEFNENGPYITEECYRFGRGSCKDVCHRVMTDAARIGLNVFNFKAKPPTILGQYEKALAARATDPQLQEKGQDGGAVTALLNYMFDNGLIDGAVTVSGISKPQSSVIRNKDELLTSQGAKYAAVPLMQALRKSDDIKNAAVVSLPCQTYGVRRAQFYTGLNVHPREIGTDAESTYIPNITYVIGLFCMENFRYELLSEALTNAGIDMDKVTKYSIHLDTMIVDTEDGEYEISLKDLSSCVWDGCKMCRDAVSKVADVSAGNIGSSAGWTTLLARNAKGVELIKKAEEAGYIETKDEVDLDLIEDFAGLKFKRFNKELKKRLDTEKGVNFYWGRDYPGVRPEVNGTFFVKVKTKSGLVDADYLAKVAELAETYGDGTLEVTTRKSIEIQGVKGEDIDALMAEIYENGLMTIGMGYAVACPGAAYCQEQLCQGAGPGHRHHGAAQADSRPHKVRGLRQVQGAVQGQRHLHRGEEVKDQQGPLHTLRRMHHGMPPRGDGGGTEGVLALDRRQRCTAPHPGIPAQGVLHRGGDPRHHGQDQQGIRQVPDPAWEAAPGEHHPRDRIRSVRGRTDGVASPSFFSFFPIS